MVFGHGKHRDATESSSRHRCGLTKKPNGKTSTRAIKSASTSYQIFLRHRCRNKSQTLDVNKQTNVSSFFEPTYRSVVIRCAYVRRQLVTLKKKLVQNIRSVNATLDNESTGSRNCFDYCRCIPARTHARMHEYLYKYFYNFIKVEPWYSQQYVKATSRNETIIEAGVKSEALFLDRNNLHMESTYVHVQF